MFSPASLYVCLVLANFCFRKLQSHDVTLLLLFLPHHGPPELKVEEDGVDHHDGNNHCVQTIEERQVINKAWSHGYVRGLDSGHDIDIGGVVCHGTVREVDAVAD